MDSLQGFVVLTHALGFVCNVSHVFLHSIKVIEGIREEFEVALDIFDEVTFNGFQMLCKGLIHVLNMRLRGDLKDIGREPESL